MRIRRRVFYTFVWVMMAGLAAPAFTSKVIPATKARNHIGETATVCGIVASTHYAVTSRGRPTFLNVGRPYPDQIFTVVIWGRDRSKFGVPERVFRNKNICVNGLIQSYRGTPEIVAHSPEQIRKKGHNGGESSTSVPRGATARCRDGTYSYSQHHRGTCSHHGGVAEWLH